MKMPAGGPKTSDGQAFLPRKAREARGGSCKAPRAKWGGAGGNEIPRAKLVSGGELVHRIVFARRLQRRFAGEIRSEEHTSELQSLMRISYAVFCLKKKR